MANHHRGEIDATLDGRSYNLCLTLGALAELEAAFGDDDMLALAERFGRGRLSARDAVRIIGAGLRGGGHDVADTAVARMHAENGAAGFVDIVARLLAATFGAAASPAGGNAPRGSADEEAHPSPGPVPGPR
jgi:hypothetical protein